MVHHIRKRKCKHCKVFFAPDPRSAGRQHYCSHTPCRQASKAASQHRWLRKPENRDDFRGPAHVARGRQWRQNNPGYWRRKALHVPDALQEPLTPQGLETQPVEGSLTRYALQDSFFIQPTVVIGLIAHFTGLS